MACLLNQNKIHQQDQQQRSDDQNGEKFAHFFFVFDCALTLAG